ncbi:hypothetical protein ACFV84_36740 [Kitasatospora sp. NPDC059811]|uniref:hypothetical protein n=1 Tax=Streptomycetaceae TaxID=2062 RepID=UPI0007AF0C7F|nr:hypothetical protein [Streptomyces sp. MJM8645]
MLLLGLLLMAAAGAFAGLLIADNLSGGPDYQATVLGIRLPALDSLGIFLAGLALALLFCLGLALMVLTARRSRRTRRPVRPAAHRAAHQRSQPVVRPDPPERPLPPDGGEQPAPPEERPAQ